ncbi:MAG: hypothetical protein HYY49_06090 [Ignavibacteriales bacterium]|nr:hypothetical protein [Ignavibacteriales bacterium]
MPRVTFVTKTFVLAGQKHVLQYDTEADKWHDTIFDLDGKLLYETSGARNQIDQLYKQIYNALIQTGILEPERSTMLREIEQEIRQNNDLIRKPQANEKPK